MEGILGESASIIKIRRHIVAVAPTDATVLIYGESGTGKELIARAIHDKSPRANKPYIPINITAIPDTLLEGELFGSIKGAYTGSVANRLGKFELADEGTLFLDEIGDMPQNMQVKILRALQERQIYPLGDGTGKTVDVRFIVATNKDLKAEMKAGRFRSDLYYRVNVYPIYVPPLRERPEDIGVLLVHYLDKYHYSGARGYKIVV
ncbi:sigma-54-dependent Fis family transcriptional regulator, partial [Candidatus Woesearchaeota archaeon]|nr:sigma-54-dependent Fis family transcriptional regulator [Candidatus Woesearchaeota archaeon]